MSPDFSSSFPKFSKDKAFLTKLSEIEPDVPAAPIFVLEPTSPPTEALLIIQPIGFDGFSICSDTLPSAEQDARIPSLAPTNPPNSSWLYLRSSDTSMLPAERLSVISPPEPFLPANSPAASAYCIICPKFRMTCTLLSQRRMLPLLSPTNPPIYTGSGLELGPASSQVISIVPLARLLSILP